MSEAPKDAWVDDEAGLSRVLDALRPLKTLTFDTEFLWERTYRPVLALLQVAGRTEDGDLVAFAVDPLAVDPLPLVELLTEPERLKVVHAGRLDQQVVYDLIGAPLRPVFDTQKAASLAGLGPQIGYGKLVEALLGRRLPKGEQYTDWTRRPLRDTQVEYALMDVIPLLDVYDQLSSQLEARGRAAWAEQEMASLMDPAAYAPTPPQDLFTKVKRHKTLDPRGLGALRELTVWREKEAEARDWRPGHVIKDPSLIELAHRRPRTLKALKSVRGLHAREVQRSGKAILRCIEAAMKLADKDLPRITKKKRGPNVSAAVDLLKAMVALRAEETGVAVETLVTTAELERLARDAQRERFTRDHPVLEGWRGDLVGSDLLKLLRGELTLGVDPESSALRLVDTEGE